MSGSITTPAVPTTENCRFCWMCRHACPVGHVSHRETYTPHAWALTIESVKRGQLVWNDESVSVLYACADCGLCQAHCATDQPLPDAIASARAEVVAAGAGPAAVYAFDERLRAANASRLKPHASGPTPQAPRPKSVVALFAGDLGGGGQAVVDAAVLLLAAANVRAVPICAGQSTGSVAASLGLRETAIACGQGVLAELTAAGVAELLVLTPADRWTFEHVYPHRLGLEWPAGVAVREVTSVLAPALTEGTLRFKSTPADALYAYHDPCHTARLQRDDRAPRALLEMALGHTGRKMFWRERRAHPCGATGGLDITHPKLAAALADARLADATAAGAKTLVTDDPVCAEHLQRHAHGSMRVVGMYELLAERLA